MSGARLAPLLLAAAVGASAAPAPGAERDVAAAFARIRDLLAAQKGRHARDVAARDRRAFAAGEGLRRHGWRAVEPLAAIARDLRRPPKERLLAASFLGLSADPLAAPALEALLLDARQHPLVRAAAAESLGALPLPPELARRALTRALADPALPDAARDAALPALAGLGLSDPEPARRLARVLGARPRGRALEAARLNARALGRTRGAAALDGLLELLRLYPEDSAPRGEAIAALGRRHNELLAFRRDGAAKAAARALASERRDPTRLLVFVRLAAELGPEFAPPLSRLALYYRDAEVAVECAEALLRFGDEDWAARALPGLEAIELGPLADPPFSSAPGRPDPAALLTRLTKANAALRAMTAGPTARDN